MARKLLLADKEQLFDHFKGTFELVFDDGSIITTARKTLYSWYSWKLIRLYPLTPFLTKHHLQVVSGDSAFNAKTQLKLLKAIVWDVYNHYVKIGQYRNDDETGKEFLDHLAKLCYEIAANDVYSEMQERAEPNVTSISIIDFLEVSESSVMKEANALFDGTANTVAAVHSAAKAALKDKSLEHNRIVKASNIGVIKGNQVMQCFAPMGMLPDIDYNIFPYPVTGNFSTGMRTLYNSGVESRSASLSLYLNREAIKKSEYFARRLQMIDETVTTLHPGDCGSTSYLKWLVKPERIEHGFKIDSDLDKLLGSYFVDEENGNTIRPITKKDTHLVGKYVRLRNPVAGCACKDPTGICSVCFGELSYSVPIGANLGHMCSSSTTENVTQLQLSNKHYIGSAVIAEIQLTEHDKKYLHTKPRDKLSYYLNETWEGKGLKLIINPEQAFGLSDAMKESIDHEFSVSRVSEIKAIGFKTNKTKAGDMDQVNVAMTRRLASLSREMLRFIKEKEVGWTVDENNNYVIDMEGWNYKNPAFVLPLREFSMSDLAKTIEGIIESKVSDIERRDNRSMAQVVLSELFDTVNSKLNINIAALSVIVYGTMIRSAAQGDYRLPKPDTDAGVGVMKAVFKNRSLSAVMAYQGQGAALSDVTSFTYENRTDHPMDVFIMPKETIEYYKKNSSIDYSCKKK